MAHGRLYSSAEAAEILGVGRSTLFRALHAEGATYQLVMERVRLEKARKLLREPALTIKEIAHAVGYSGPNNFVRAFRRLSGLTPGEFRKIETA